MQEKIDELEKDKKEFDSKLKQEKLKHDQKLVGYKKVMESKQVELEKLKKEYKDFKNQQAVNASLDRSCDTNPGPYEKK